MSDLWKKRVELHGGRAVCYLGDSLEILPTLPAGSVDAVVTDPPYNVGLDYASDPSEDNKGDYEEWCARWFLQCQRVAKIVCLSCGIVNLSIWFRIAPPSWVCCWWKPAAMGRSPFGFCNWEPMPVWGRSPHNQGCDVVRAPILPSNELAGHPCPKPVEWGRGFVALVSLDGQMILDPFMGSGTTGVAAVQLGRKFVGIEIDPGYFDIACKRIENTPAPMTGDPKQDKGKVAFF